MELGFVSAIFPDLSLDEVIQFASSQDFSCVELMCWSKGKAERRYVGVTHIDVVGLTEASANQILEMMESAGVSISGLGYYPNPLAPDTDEVQVYIDHLKQVIEAAALLKVNLVNTFIGRDWTLSIDDNWPRARYSRCSSRICEY
jgi:sugar phosphate isomerase/epimerase